MPETKEIEVTLAPLDQILPSGYRVDLIKIDVEGAEQQVIEGAIETIRAQAPMVIFEHGVGSANVYGTGPLDIHELLVVQAGMRIFDLEGGGPYTAEAFEHAFNEHEHVNFLARP